MREMKDSGVEWIGSIPVEWKVDKIRYHLRRIEPRNPGNKIVLSLYRELGIVPKDSRDDNHNVTSEDTSKYKYVRKGDFVINKMKAWQGSVAVSEYEGIVSPAYYVYHFIDDKYNKKYFHYLLRGCYKDEFMRLSAGIRVGQWDLSSDAVDNTVVLIPDKVEQQKIADFLDKKCAEIDTLTSDIQKQIDTLEQYKKSVITEAVTKGLNPDAEMKDSGIDFIGKMPLNFKIVRVKNIGSARNGLTYTPFDLCDEQEGILVLRSSNVQNGQIVFKDNVYVKCNVPPKLIVQQGDILICSRNGSKELIGKNAIIDENINASFGAFMMIYRCNVPKYMYYILNSEIFKYYLGSFFTSTINQLTNYNFGNMKIPYCFDEVIQKQITDYLDKKCSEIDTIISDKKKQLEVITEYKKSLIYEYVTGKKEVM